jgi:hypothetical protein
MKTKMVTAFLTVASLALLSWGQDFKMNSNTGSGVLLEVRNTGTANPYKTGVQVEAGAGGTGIEILDGYRGTRVINSQVGYSYEWYYGPSNVTGFDAYITGGENTTAIGVTAYVANWGNSLNIGVSGIAYGASGGINYGVYGSSYGDPGAAGYFDGDIYGYGPYPPSDRKLKKDIKDYEGGLQTVMALKPRTYSMRQDEFKGKMSLPSGHQIGFISQEVQQVLPGLVKTAKSPAHLTQEEAKNKVKKQPTEYLALDYTGMIPVLVKAVQEQQALIEAMKVEIAALKAK